MKNLLKLIGIIAFAAVIGFAMTACEEAAEIGSVTITGIPSTYNGKFVMMLVDKGNEVQAYGMGTISGTSHTFNLLDWDDDESTTISEGNYGVTIMIAQNMKAITDDEEEYIGVIFSKSFSGTTVSIAFSDFIDGTAGTSDQFEATVTGIPPEHNGKYASVYVYNITSTGGYGTAAGSSNRVSISNGTVTVPLFVNDGLITTTPLTTLASGTYHASLFMYTAASGAGNNFYQSHRYEITVTEGAKNINIAFASLTQIE